MHDAAGPHPTAFLGSAVSPSCLPHGHVGCGLTKPTGSPNSREVFTLSLALVILGLVLPTGEAFL